jgi:hypothetical protein
VRALCIGRCKQLHPAMIDREQRHEDIRSPQAVRNVNCRGSTRRLVLRCVR